MGKSSFQHYHPRFAPTPFRGLPLRPGLALAIEPMSMAGGEDKFTTDDDGWALRTADRGRAAHAEHTVAITDGPVIMTAP